MTTVVGIDLSLTCSGIATIIDTGTECKVQAASFTSSGKRADSLIGRANRIGKLAIEVLSEVGRPNLAVVEGASHGSRGGSPMDRHFLWWQVVDGLIGRGVPVAVVAPPTRAKFATGNGRADKAAVAGAVCRLWPDLVLANSDEGDAAALAHMGAVWLNLPVLTLERHKQSLAAVKWPLMEGVDW